MHKTIEAIGTSVDLSQRLEQQALIFETTLSAITDFAYIFDRDGRFIYANKALLDLWGLKLADAVGKNFFDLNYPKELAQRLQDQIQQVFKSGKGVTDETLYVSPSGVGGFYEYIFKPVISDNGHVTAVAGSTREITERKRTEQSLKEKATELQALNRNLEDFAHIISHDLQSPLKKIVTYSELLQEELGTALTEQSRNHLERIRSTSKKMSQLISSLLTYSKTTAATDGVIPTEMSRIVSDVISDLEILIVKRGAQVKVESLPTVLARPVQMHQLFVNLISNAIKYSDKQPIQIKISAAKNKREWIFCVQDNGIGIQERYLSQIFELFQRVDLTKEGTGVGLAICKKIIQSHNGRIWAESLPGQGSRFFFTLPAEAQ